MVCVRKTGAVESRAPRDSVASNHHCLLCMSCIGSFSDCARRCSPLRTPCTGSLSERAGRCPLPRNPYTGALSDCAGRCSPLRTPCTRSFSERAGRYSPLRTPCKGSFADCAHIAPASLLLLASPLCCFLPRLRLQPPASCYPLHPADSLPCCRVCRCCTAPALPLVAAPPASGSGPASAWAGSLPFPLPPLSASARPPRAPCPAPSGAATAPLTAGTASSRAPRCQPCHLRSTIPCSRQINDSCYDRARRGSPGARALERRFPLHRVGAEQTRVRAEVRLHLVVGLHLDFDPVIHRLLGQVSRLEIGARVR